MTSFAFLTAQYLIACASAISPFSDPGFDIYEFTSSQSKALFTFQLPPLSDSIYTVEVEIKSDPSAPSWTPNLSPEVPFCAKRDTRLYAIGLDILDHHEVSDKSWLVFHSTALLAHVTLLLQALERPGPSETCSKITWDKWGNSTRIIPRPEFDTNSVWFDASISGMHFITSTLDDDDTDNGLDSFKTLAVIHDFNQLALKKAAASGNEVGLVTGPTEIPTPENYATAIITPLPYRFCHIKTEERFKDAMCTEDNIVLVRVSHLHCLNKLQHH